MEITEQNYGNMLVLTHSYFTLDLYNILTF